jgi:hypothetical protein
VYKTENQLFIYEIIHTFYTIAAILSLVFVIFLVKEFINPEEERDLKTTFVE